ncbi:hypothetical protein Hanom_Chr07g00679501 [Helianthus anomalus]
MLCRSLHLAGSSEVEERLKEIVLKERINKLKVSTNNLKMLNISWLIYG